MTKWIILIRVFIANKIMAQLSTDRRPITSQLNWPIWSITRVKVSCIMSIDSIFSENDYHKGCRNVSHCQQQSFSGLQQLYVHPAGDHAPHTYQMTPGFKHFTVLYPTAMPSSGWLMITKSLVCGVTILSVNGHLSCYHLCNINIMKMEALFLARSHLVGSSLLSELLNWPWARTKLPLKLNYDRSFNKDLFNFCCCLALVLIGISVAKLDHL